MVDWISQDIIEDGGEGVILRKVGSFYEHGRTSSLIKLKVPNSFNSSFHFLFYSDLFYFLIF